MTINSVRKSIQFIQFLNTRWNSLYQSFHKNEELLKIIENKQINTFFQPVVSLTHGTTIGFETLNRPQVNPIFTSTEAFYDFIDESNHVYTVERSIRNLTIHRFHEQVKQCGTHALQLFFNIHPKVLASPQYLEETLELLASFHMRPEQIVLEITERKSGLSHSEIKRHVDEFRKTSFQIALDDVGTGYNSLQTLFHVQPEIIKIDKSLIRDIETSPDKQRLASFIIDFATESKAKIIAEGIETVSEYNFLQQMGIDLGQGYAIGRPERTLTNGKIPCEKAQNTIV